MDGLTGGRDGGPHRTDRSLTNPIWAALVSRHAGLAQARGRARRYPADVSVFAGVDELDDRSWADLAVLLGPGGRGVLAREHIPAPPAGWDVPLRLPGFQYTVAADDVVAVEPVPARPLVVDDVGAMLDLVAQAQPGPFLARTIEMGAYVGVFDGGRLVAMAGERLRLDGWTEISAVCTHPDARGRGLGAVVVSLVVAGILDRGERPFLHVVVDNTAAIGLYERLGFVRSRVLDFALVQAP